MSDNTRVQRNCLSCDHPELLPGLAGMGQGQSARFIALFDRATRRSFWMGTRYEAQSLVCPNCGHVEMTLKPEELTLLQAKLGMGTKKPS